MRAGAVTGMLLSCAVLVACSAVGSPRPRSTWTGPGGAEVVAYAGDKHCDWQSLTVLRLDDKRQYVRDPEGIVEKQWLASTYNAQATLPRDATNTGYNHDDEQLWLSADESAAFVVAPGGTEQ